MTDILTRLRRVEAVRRLAEITGNTSIITLIDVLGEAADEIESDRAVIESLESTIDYLKRTLERANARGDRLQAALSEANARAERSALNSIEARNPGIDMDEVRRTFNRPKPPNTCWRCGRVPYAQGQLGAVRCDCVM